jgi:laminin, gamma 1
LDIGCLPCFCYGHSSNCESASNYISSDVSSDKANLNSWTGVDSDNKPVFIGYENKSESIFIFSQDREAWLSAPREFLGDQSLSYNQFIDFRLKFSLMHSSATRKDLIIENAAAGLSAYRSIYDLVNANDYKDNLDMITKHFKFNLKESDGWRPSLSSLNFQILLSNITSIRIKATNNGYTLLDQFNLKTAVKSNDEVFLSMKGANWVEKCICPKGHIGEFCQNCDIGYRRSIPFGGSLIQCVPCSCNNHSISCEAESGKCDCIHHTTGENCETCEDEYYGNPLDNTPIDCKKCPCPNDGPCGEFQNYQSNSIDVVCLDCPIGTKGNLCDLCEDGFHIISNQNEPLVCEKCECNDNIDYRNAVYNCDAQTGDCLRCIYNTTGKDCSECLPDYWGDALSSIKCHSCDCHPVGSVNEKCNLDNGQCECQPNVIGRQCNQCKDTFWNMTQGVGCEECRCDPLGSVDLNCDSISGQCKCLPGVTGVKCNECLPNHYNFSSIVISFGPFKFIELYSKFVIVFFSKGM